MSCVPYSYNDWSSPIDLFTHRRSHMNISLLSLSYWNHNNLVIFLWHQRKNDLGRNFDKNHYNFLWKKNIYTQDYLRKICKFHFDELYLKLIGSRLTSTQINFKPRLTIIQINCRVWTPPFHRWSTARPCQAMTIPWPAYILFITTTDLYYNDHFVITRIAVLFWRPCLQKRLVTVHGTQRLAGQSSCY